MTVCQFCINGYKGKIYVKIYLTKFWTWLNHKQLCLFFILNFSIHDRNLTIRLCSSGKSPYSPTEGNWKKCSILGGAMDIFWKHTFLGGGGRSQRPKSLREGGFSLKKSLLLRKLWIFCGTKHFIRKFQTDKLVLEQFVSSLWLVVSCCVLNFPKYSVVLFMQVHWNETSETLDHHTRLSCRMNIACETSQDRNWEDLES